MKGPLADKDRRIGETSEQKNSPEGAASQRELSFRTIRIYSVHKWMHIADTLSWVFLAVLMWGLKLLGKETVRGILEKLRHRDTR